MSEQFPPGTWIKRGSSGPVAVITATENSLTVLLVDGIATFIVSDKGPVVSKLDRPPLDLTLPRERRRLWSWQNKDMFRGHRPCPCCGYPNLGIGDAFDIEPVQCLICGWIDQWDEEEDADEVRSIPHPGDPLDLEWPNWGYSLTEARRNFEARGLMFRRGDPRAKPLAKVATQRRRLRQLLDETMTNDPKGRTENGQSVEQLRETIIGTFTQQKMPS